MRNTEVHFLNLPVVTSRIQKGGALLADMRQLVCHWDQKPENVGGERFAQMLLAKATQARASDTFLCAFVPRMIEGSPKNAWRLCRALEERRAPLEIVVPFYYWVTARAESIMYRFAVEALFPAAKAGALGIETHEVVNWIKATCKSDGKVWSDSVTVRVARAILAGLRDFCVLSGASKKTIAPSNLSLEAFSLVGWCLRNQLGDHRDLKTHPDWRLFLLSPDNVERLLLEAHLHGWLHYQVAGAVTRIEFPSTDFNEYVEIVLSR